MEKYKWIKSILPSKFKWKKQEKHGKGKERPQSFGLHSPDQLPRSESEFRAIATSFGLHSPDNKVPAEFLHPSYNPRLFCDGGLYLDPDIIDLTLIPPPKTPDQEKLIDFSCTAIEAAPPGFTDENGDRVFNTSADSGDLPPGFINDIPLEILEHIDQLVQNDEELGTQLAAMDAMLLHQTEEAGQNDKESGIESESDSGNETISSENVDYVGASLGDHMGSHIDHTMDTLNLDTDDIDAFIARVTVPPPPKDSLEDVNLPITSVFKMTSIQPAKMRLPPPPDLVQETQSFKRNSRADSSMDSDVFLPSAPTSATWHKDLTSEEAFCMALEAEFAQYVIPPPPISETADLDLIPIVPPVDIKTPSPVTEYPPPIMTSETVEIRTGRVKQGSPKLKRTDSIERNKGSNVTALMKVFSGKPVMEGNTGQRNSPSSRRKLGSRESSVNSDQGDSPSRSDAGREKLTGSEPGGLVSPTKPRPPLPPKRNTSLEGSESAPVSPVTNGSAKSSPGDGGIKSRLLWRPAETKSADNSPVHKGKDFKEHIRGSTGTINRPRRTPPPPPPRRSSILQGSSSSGSLPDEVNTTSPGSSVEARSRTLEHSLQRNHVDLASKRDYVNVNPVPPIAENVVSKPPAARSVSSPPEVGGGGGGIKSELERVLLARGSPKTEPKLGHQAPSPVEAPAAASDVVVETSFKDDADDIKTKSASSIATHQETNEPKQNPSDYIPETITIPKPVVDVSRIPRSHRERNGSSEKKEELDSSVSSSEEKSSGTTPSPRTYRSPSFSRKLLMFDFNKNAGDDKDINSEGGNADAYDSDSSITPPQSVSVSSRGNSLPAGSQSKAYASPKNSPSASRQSSFTKMAEKAASPLRSLFGGRNRTLSADSEGGVSPSPQKIPSYRSSLPLTKSGPRPMSASPSMQRKNGQKKGNSSGKAVYPLMTTSSPETETPPPPPISPLQETCSIPPIRPNGEAMTTFGKSTDSGSPNSPKVTRGPKSQTESKIPPWKSTATAAAAASAKKQAGSPVHRSGTAQTAQKHPNGSVNAGATSGEDRVQDKDKDSKASATASPSKQPVTASPSKQPSVIGYAAERIMSKKYQGEGAFNQAGSDIDTLVKLVDDSLTEIKKPNFQTCPEEFAECKEILVTQARQFVTDSKLLVSSATQCKEKLIENVNNSVRTLARMVYHCRLTMRTLPSNQAQNLAMRLKDVATAFKTTMNAANIAAGKPLNDPQMKLLMRQATSLAAILSTLMKTLKVLDSS